MSSTNELKLYPAKKKAHLDTALSSLSSLSFKIDKMNESNFSSVCLDGLQL